MKLQFVPDIKNWSRWWSVRLSILSGAFSAVIAAYMTLPPDWLPAPAQGAIAVECRDDAADVLALCAALDDADTRVCVEAERAMNRALHGSCHVPVAAFARLADGRLHLSGLVGSARDGARVRAEAEAPRDAAEALGREVAARLLAQGARELIAACAEPDTGPCAS